MFEKIKKYYDMGLYKKVHLEKLLTVGAITEEQYEKIVKEADNG